ncbi:unnamed protein product [Penicillium salamii]|uniref:HNH nuclease domain-containing protein n=1 Tax=Penicillium salamii TaxID=1612424 RepID=A0A9W4ITN7_9EURO|nr:unnamed protein product [Penicillium salamii]CAG7995235.1 unnamed protein product [Penicillium salamii]CAG8165290.1 unnamed protein product [Penicillium salamii]CAG8192719.1 unnamed protein product [Penicillium salamii]CAG8227019.1 unnamed protein product [Penicillium salamii]
MSGHITSITDGEARSDSRLSHPVPSSTSHFLDTKIATLQHETVQIIHLKEDLGESLDCAKISPEQYNQEIYPILKRFRKTSQMLQVLARQRSLIEEDFEEAVESMRQRTLGLLDDNIFETVYEDTIVPCVIRAAAKVGKSRSDKRSFKKAVRQWYNVTNESLALVFGMEGLTEPYSICHVIGAPVDYLCSEQAYLVPKSLSPNEVSYIFGIAEDVISSDPQNALLLNYRIKRLFDEGFIAIVPSTTRPTAWRCVVLDNSKNDNYVWGNSKVKDLDNRELLFISDERPRPRYLYFRFIVSYLRAKRLNRIDLSIEVKKYWPLRGKWLNRSTLKTFAKCVTGYDLPDEFITDYTFEDTRSEARNHEAGMILAADILDQLNHPVREKDRYSY